VVDISEGLRRFVAGAESMSDARFLDVGGSVVGDGYGGDVELLKL